ncbi:maleylpyruvate isomerase family mycothiol-dependent enzyme [Nocardiopsis exhalans]|uniref:Maleylpyruvate isomerase family mycothiol-dependent enzyme n=1 Tax=Nocardiopsis exhalans TaxID=163604 RepID=A0ABY5DB40_9ACTN|nr:maleylpyruvate isomerase family mycothiol-dependent enzyme [Nocardiopsis exhalans]USY20291.1 maleylpyruvate isomerase family mycothiol-dependent enzyme [Nocardiopsis exhalans]
MGPEECWRIIEKERLELADLLGELDESQLNTASLCEGWRVRDVAGHLAGVADPPSPGRMLLDVVRAGGSFHRLNRDSAIRNADRLGPRLADELRALAASRRLPAVTNYRNTLFDVLVHGQDISAPLGITRVMPVEAACAGATQVWSIGFPFHARRRLDGLRLTATDADWQVGSGAEVRGPIQALLLFLTGRTTALGSLSGAGMEAFRTSP